MVIIVLAGAVAVAMAPRISAKFHDIPNIILMLIVTRIPAASASKIVMIITLIPASLITSFLKNFPTPKAINASAISLINPICPRISDGTIFKQHGPIKTPAII